MPTIELDQITTIVQGFIDQWIKFESNLHKELAKTHPLSQKNINGETQAEDNYGLFYRVSSIIQTRDRVTMGDFSGALSIPFSKATRIINWLFANGYVKRMDDSHDRRVVLIALTDKGSELYRVIDNFTRERVEQLLSSGLNSEEKVIFFTLINKVVVAIKKAAQ